MLVWKGIPIVCGHIVEVAVLHVLPINLICFKSLLQPTKNNVEIIFYKQGIKCINLVFVTSYVALREHYPRIYEISLASQLAVMVLRSTHRIASNKRALTICWVISTDGGAHDVNCTR